MKREKISSSFFTLLTSMIFALDKTWKFTACLQPDKAIDLAASRDQATLTGRKATERQYFKNYNLKNVYFILYNPIFIIFLPYEYNFPILQDIKTLPGSTIPDLYRFCQGSEYTNKLCKVFLFFTGQL